MFVVDEDHNILYAAFGCTFFVCLTTKKKDFLPIFSSLSGLAPYSRDDKISWKSNIFCRKAKRDFVQPNAAQVLWRP